MASGYVHQEEPDLSFPIQIMEAFTPKKVIGHWVVMDLGKDSLVILYR